MTLEDWKKLPFKVSDEPMCNGDEFGNLPRPQRRWILKQLKKGKVPSILDAYDIVNDY